MGNNRWHNPPRYGGRIGFIYWFQDTGFNNLDHGPFTTLSQMRDHTNRARMRAEMAGETFPAPHQLIAYRKRKTHLHPCRRYGWNMGAAGLYPYIDHDFLKDLPPEAPEDIPDPNIETASAMIERLQNDDLWDD